VLWIRPTSLTRPSYRPSKINNTRMATPASPFILVHTGSPTLDENIATFLHRQGQSAVHTGALPADHDAPLFLIGTQATLATTHHPAHSTFLCPPNTPTALSELVTRIESWRNQQLHHDQIPLRHDIQLDLRERSLRHHDQCIPLTQRETELLHYLHDHRHAPTSKEKLLTEVWGYHSEADTHTLETHMYRLRQKLQEISAQLAIEFTDAGYELTSSN
jgi:hypothetical protein